MSKPMLKQCLHRHATFNDATSFGRRREFSLPCPRVADTATGRLAAFLSRMLFRQQPVEASIPAARLQAVLGGAAISGPRQSPKR